MKKVLLIGICLFCFGPLSLAQIDLAKYFDNNSIPFLSTQEYLEVDFKWNMKGNIQVLLNEGLNNLREDKILVSITNFDEVIKLDSTIWISYYYRGVCYKKLNNIQKSYADFLTCIRFNPEQGEAYFELGKIYQQKQDYINASKQYEKAIKVSPGLVQAHYNLGNVDMISGNLRSALNHYQKCNEVNPKFPDAYMAQGVLKFKVKKNDNQSIPLFNQAIAADSTFSQAYFWRGYAFLSLNQSEKGLQDWSRFIAFNPGNTFMLMMRGYLHIEMNNFDAAFVDLRKALLTHDVHEDQYLGAQTLLDKKIDLQTVAKYLIRNGYGLEEESFGYLKKGFCLILADRMNEALANIKKSEKIQPSATVYYLQALTYEHLEKHDSAFNYYSRALRLDNDIFDAHKKRGIYWYKLKNWKKAYADFNEMQRLQPESYVTYRLRGLVKSNEGDFAGAIADLSKFIAVDSSDYEALKTRALCREQTGDVQGANDDLRRILYFQSLNWNLFADVGQNYFILKDTTASITIYKEYAENYRQRTGNFLNTNFFVPHLRLLEIFITIKDWNLARLELDVLYAALDSQEKRNRYPQEYASILFFDGLMAFYQSNYQLAIDKFSQSLRINKANLEARYLRAKAYEKAGRKNDSISDFKYLREQGFNESESLYKAAAEK